MRPSSLGAVGKRLTCERLASGPIWPVHTYEGERLDLVFTTDHGGLVTRQHVDKLVHAKA